MNLPERHWPVVLQRPQQGWSSLLLLLGMLAVVGISVADSRPLLVSGQDRTGSLVVAMLAAGLIGFVLARSSIGVVRAHIIGAAAGAFVLLLITAAAVTDVASVLVLQPGELGDRITRLLLQIRSDMDMYLRDDAEVPTVVTYLVLGTIGWTTAQFSAFSVFRYDRGGPAVMATGAVLFLNVGLGALRPTAGLLPVVPVLAAFSALAMLLLMRLQLTQQSYGWARRHIANSGEVTRLFLRTGTLFVAFTVASAGSLTFVARAAPQQVDFGGLEEPLGGLREEISRLLPFLAIPGAKEAASFNGYTPVPDDWIQPEGIAFTASVDGSLRGNYWWGYMQDTFDGRGWNRQALDEEAVPAGKPLPTPDDSSGGQLYPLTARIVIADGGVVRSRVFRPAEAVTLDKAVKAYLVDERRSVGDLVLQDQLKPGDRLEVTSNVRDYQKGGQSLTADELRAAGTDYPPGMEERYLQGRGDVAITGARAPRLALRISVREDNPYDRAVELQDLLRDMTYETRMLGKCRQGENTSDCLLRTQQGFCTYFATTMIMVLREMGIPSRLITGYLPGKAIDATTYEVENQAFHNWVEAYFPGYGWVRFDPTPGLGIYNQRETAFQDEPEPPGADSSAPPATEPSPPAELPEAEASPLGSPGVLEPPPGGGDALGVLLVTSGLAALLLVTIVGLLFFRLRRLPEGDAGLAYRGIVSLATRLGYGPRPSQTEYEYAGSLGETLPSVREELYVVAGARVESAYGQRQLDATRRGVLRRAYARIRTALLRMSLRRR